MANFVLDKTYAATGTTAYAYGEVVSFNNSVTNGCSRTTTANDPLAFGVATQPVKAEHVTYGNASVPVRVMGIAHVIVDVPVVMGDKLAVANTAHLVKRAGAGPVFGIAMEAGAAGTLVNVLLTPGALTTA